MQTDVNSKLDSLWTHKRRRFRVRSNINEPLNVQISMHELGIDNIFKMFLKTENTILLSEHGRYFLCCNFVGQKVIN